MTAHAYADEETIKRLLLRHCWALVGLSVNPARPAYGVARFLQRHGKQVVPVHPKAETVHDEPGYAKLSDVPMRIDVVDCFVNSTRVGAVVDQAIAAGAKAVWMQLGVVDVEAADRARAADLDVVMDRCPAIEWRRLGPASMGG